MDFRFSDRQVKYAAGFYLAVMLFRLDFIKENIRDSV
jgi:hypothetical protein